jgi:hypothetical protein
MATDGMFYEFHIPLGLYDAIQTLLRQQQASPNSPNVITPTTTGRQWFSQPRPAVQGEITKPTFFYAVGISHLFSLFGVGIANVGGGSTLTVPGVDNKTYTWNGAPGTDPFPSMVDATYWNVKRVEYSASAYPYLNSLATGAEAVVAAIKATPGKFALGGYGLGAAVIARVWEEIQYGTLASRKNDLIAAVTFGSPAREASHLWPGATPIGSWDAPSTTTGSHGVFPSDRRMTSTPAVWWDFANADDVFSSVGNTTAGTNLSALTAVLTNTFTGKDLLAFISANLLNLPWDTITAAASTISQVTDVLGSNGGGHSTYATSSPTGNPQNGLTSYQIALNYLNTIGKDYQASRTFGNTTEVVQVNFKMPMPINDLAFQAVQVPVSIEAWYKDRYNNWRAMLDDNRTPIKVSLSRASSEKWYAHRTEVFPVVAKAIQLRLTRVYDSGVGSTAYCVGIRNLLARRNIYSRPAGILATTITEDTMGNIVETTIKDWDPPQAIDNDPGTFWKSAAMPDPDAVAYLCLDVRDSDGTAKLIDTLYLDPVYTGNSMNLYYSNDDLNSTLRLSPISLRPTPSPSGTTWKINKGLSDITTGTSAATWAAPFQIGPQVRRDAWVGIEWAPNFSSASPPSSNPVLFEVAASGAKPGQFWPRIYYQTSPSRLVLEFTNGTSTPYSFFAPFSTTFAAGTTLRIVAGWAYNMPGEAVTVSVCTQDGTEIAAFTTTSVVDIPELVTFDGKVGFSRFKGLLTAHVVKLASWTDSGGKADFQANPMSFVDPEPTIPDPDGQIGSSSLDNAVLSCDWRTQQYPIGGSHTSAYVDRKWVPVWRDYVTKKGKMFLPHQIRAQYLKLEFSKLTPEPYPIYDTGIQVTYETFPISVYSDYKSTSTTTTTVNRRVPGLLENVGDATAQFVGNAVGTITGAAGAIGGAINGVLGTIGNLVGGIASVNWLDATSVRAAIEAPFTAVAQPIVAALGYSNPVQSLPNTLISAVSTVSNTFMSTSNTSNTLTSVSSIGTAAIQAATATAAVTPSTLAAARASNRLSISLPPRAVNPRLPRVNIANTLNNVTKTLTSSLAGLTNTGSPLVSAGSSALSVIQQEMTSSLIHRRPLLDVATLAKQSINTLLGTDVQQIVERVIPPPLVKAIESSFSPVTATTSIASPTRRPVALPPARVNNAILPTQGTDKWLFPGGNLTMPAAIMNGLTGLTQTVLGYNTSTTTSSSTSTTRRVRFETTETHIYRKLVANRDAAIGYFAGIREVAAYSTAYIDNEDPVSFHFNLYDKTQWAFSSNIQTLSATGGGYAGVTAQPMLYSNADIDFTLDLDAWTKTGAWAWDNTQDGYTGNRVQAAKLTPAGTNATLVARDTIDVTAGDVLVVSGFTKHINVPTNPNIATNPSFENTALYVGTTGGAYSTEQARTGTRSLKLIGNGTARYSYVTSSTTAVTYTPSVANDVWYVEGYVYGKSGVGGNTQTTGGANAIQIGLTGFNSGGSSISNVVASITANTSLNGVWTKISGYVTAPASTASIAPFVQIDSTVTSGDTYYFDDVVVRRAGKITLDLVTYNSAGVATGSAALTAVPSTTAGVPATLTGLPDVSKNTDGVTFTELKGTYTVPGSGVSAVAVRYTVDSGVTGGSVWVADTKVVPSDIAKRRGTLYSRFVTTSDFSKVVCDFRDTGPMRSDAMWARMDPFNTAIDKTKLTWYTTPSTMPPGMWGDTFADWADENVKWGNAEATVAIIVDPNRVYKGNRVLRFMRGASAGQAGITVVQRTNYVPGCLARISAVFYKPEANTNSIKVSLRRISDGVYIYGGATDEGIIPDPIVGQWYTYTSPWFEIPSSLDQAYTVGFYSSGSDAEDIYLSDLFTETTHVRYHMQLGGGYSHDVTGAAVEKDAIVTATTPVKEVAITVTVLSDRVAAFGATVTPVYLK